MKRIFVIFVILVFSILLFPTAPVLAADPPDGIEIDVVVVGDNATLTVTSDGSGTLVYINGRNISDPVAYYFINPYNDAELRQAISELQTVFDSINGTVSLTTTGLAKVILVLQEHTSNLSDLLDKINQNEQESVGRDNELVNSENELHQIISDLKQKISNLEVRLTQEALKVKSLTEEQIETQTTVQQITNRMIWSGIGIGIVFIVFIIVMSILFRRTRRL